MFEKEAEEYTNNVLKGVNCNIGNPRARQINSIDVEEAYQKGAEFGYNKANEWHYPSKGEYPKDEKNVLCILGEFENINLEVGYYSQKENERERWRFSEYSTPDDSEDGWGVYAWKEIVLPKMIKE